jgi:plastocyanin
MSARAKLLLPGLALAVGIAAGPGAAGPVVVRMTKDHRFDPQVVTIESGQDVVWTNEDESPHSVVADPLRVQERIDVVPPMPPEPFHSEDVPPGGSYRRGFSLEGVTRYVCGHDEQRGMNGTVIVGPRR